MWDFGACTRGGGGGGAGIVSPPAPAHLNRSRRNPTMLSAHRHATCYHYAMRHHYALCYPRLTCQWCAQVVHKDKDTCTLIHSRLEARNILLNWAVPYTTYELSYTNRHVLAHINIHIYADTQIHLPHDRHTG